MNRILFFAAILFTGAVTAQRVTPASNNLPIPGINLQPNPATTNNNLLNSTWDEKEACVNGFSRVLSNNLFSYIDISGRLICPVQFEDARNFKNNLAAVKKNGKWGFINESGMIKVPCQYEIAFDFNGDITGVYANKKWNLIDHHGAIIASPAIDVFYGFNSGIAKVSKDNRVGLMNASGEINYTGETITPFISRTPTSAALVSNCPENIDFENGDFNNWNCFIGSVDSIGNTNVITVTPSAPINNRHRIITRVLPSAIDGFGLFPTNPPDGSNFAVKLGNTRIGGEAERIQYKIRIPANDSTFSIRYDYAVVLQDPGHTTWTQPRFTAKLFDSTANAYIDCASFEYISTSNLPGFARSSVDSSVIYKPWSTVFISLRRMAGKTLYLEFTTADCVRKGHWGYAYLDVENVCSHAIDASYECRTGIASLSAPPGFQTYNWWNQNFTTILASGQSVLLNPAPVNTTVWLEMIPFNDFGCRDSMPVNITGTFTPHFDVSEHEGICAPHRFTFYNTDIPSLSALWDFGDGTTGAGDTISHTYALPGIYVVTLTVTLPGGCNGVFSDTVKVIQPTGTFAYAGNNFCGSGTISFSSVNNGFDTLHWNFGDGTIINSTQNNITHTYTSPGVYVPSLTLISNHGCNLVVPGLDTIKIEKLIAGFKTIQTRNCGNTVVNFVDSSSSFFGISGYIWNFGDGSTGTGNSPVHTYQAAGNYNVQLIIVSPMGCRDTIIKPINITINNFPVTAISGPAQECLHIAVNFTGTVQSADAIQSMSWTSSDGSIGSGNNFTVTFSQAGSFTIQLIAITVNGCADTSNSQVIINPLPEMVQPANQQFCNGDSTTGTLFSGSLPGTTFTWTNDNPAIGLAANGSNNLPAFNTTNNTSLPITANIAVTPVANSCPGGIITFTITVNPATTIIQPANQIICNRGITDAVIFNNFTSAASAVSYSWTNDQPGIGLAAGGTGNIPSFTAINTSALPIIATITITATGSVCPAAPGTFTITINPTPDVLQPANQAVCSGVNINGIPFTSTVPGAGYTWSNNQPSIGLAANGTGDIGSFNSINNGIAPVSATIIVNAQANGCNGTPATFNIDVNPIPDVNQPANQQLCTGSSTTPVSFAGSISGTTYNWLNDQPSIGLPASGTGDILAFNPNNSGNTSSTATVTVTPTAFGCTGTPKSFSLVINPSPGVIQPLNQFQCNGETTAAVTFISPVGGTSFSWTNSLPLIGLPASGTGNIPSFTTFNNTNTAITASITVSASTNSCPGIPKTFYITVDPTPDLLQPANQTVCNGAIVNTAAFVGTVNGTTYSWINSSSAIGLAPSGNGDIPSFTATNNTYFPISGVIQVTGFANSCGSVVKVFTIKVMPSPALDEPASQAVCNRIATAAIPLTGPVSGTVFSWKNDRPSIGLPAIGTGDIPSFIAINNTNASVVANIIITGTTANCGIILDTITITVHPSANVQANNNMDVCSGSTVQLIATGAAQYSWLPITGLSCINCSNPTVIPTDSIMYIVKGISQFGCAGYDSVSMVVRMPFDMLTPPNDSLCIGRSINLRATNATSYLWSPPNGLNRVDIPNPTATPTTTTQYRVVGYDAYHCFTDTGYVTITVGPKPIVNIGADLTTANGVPVTFHPTIQNGPIVRYTWTPASELSCSDCPNPTANIKNNMMYTVKVENSFGCTAVDSIFVTAFCRKAEVFVPNAFTPDGDGLNDILMIRGTGIMVKSFRVFNRWGELIFEKLNFGANDSRYGWDGKIRGVPAVPGVYVYTAEVVCDNGAVYTYKGNTSILK